MTNDGDDERSFDDNRGRCSLRLGMWSWSRVEPTTKPPLTVVAPAAPASLQVPAMVGDLLPWDLCGS